MHFRHLLFLPVASALTPTQRAETALTALQTWYNTSSGIWDTCGWWNGANCLTALADLAAVDASVRSTASSVFSNTFSVAPRSNPAPGRGNSTYTHATDGNTNANANANTNVNVNVTQWLDGAYDDDAWWALGWIAAYDVTGRQEYLDLAVGIFEKLSQVWPSRCGGGIYWDYTHSYVNAIANELFLSLAAHLANRVDEDVYVSWAEREWAWFQGSGMINANHTINDGLTEDCKNNGQTTWTYNQGVILGGLAELYRATDNETYLESATQIASAAITALTDSNHVLHESCEPDGCGGDSTQFKGIFIRNLRLLHSVAPDEMYRQVIDASANSIWTHDRDDSGRMGVNWAGPLRNVDASSHSSALDALVATIDL